MTGYQFPDLPGGGSRDWDANWVVVDGTVHTETRESWRFTEPCLTTWEASKLEAWLHRVADLVRTSSARAAAVDPDASAAAGPDADPDAACSADAGPDADPDAASSADADPDAAASIELAFTEPDLAFRADVTSPADLTPSADVAFPTDGSTIAGPAGVDVTVRVRLAHGAAPGGSGHPFVLEIPTSADALEAAARQWRVERFRFPPR